MLILTSNGLSSDNLIKGINDGQAVIVNSNDYFII